MVLSTARMDIDGVACLISTSTDVTEERAHEQALRRSEGKARARADELAALMDAVPAVVWISRDPDCREMYGNRTGCEMTGLPPGENLSNTAHDSGTPRLLVHREWRGDAGRPASAAARGARRRAAKPRRPIRFADGRCHASLRERGSAARPEPATRAERSRCSSTSPAETGGGGAARGRPAQGRVPGDARRTSCATRSRRSSPRCELIKLRGDVDARRASIDDHRAPGAAPGPARRRPARRVAHHARARSSCDAARSSCATCRGTAVEVAGPLLEQRAARLQRRRSPRSGLVRSTPTRRA